MKSKILVVFFLTVMQCSFVSQASPYKLTITSGIDEGQLKEKIESNVASLLTDFKLAIDNGRPPRFSRNYVTKEGEEAIKNMWKTSEFLCQEADINEICISDPQGGYEIRNIPVTMLAAGEESRRQEIVVKLTKDGIVNDVYIAMDKNKYLDIINENSSVTDMRRRQVIIDFVENYRTAYNRKDLPFINDVFSENALIITGKVVKKSKVSDRALYAGMKDSEEKIIYIRQSKKEYISKLQNVFKQNALINVKFDQIEVVQHPKYDNIYGVTLIQDWNTTRYSDVGYLFLMIEFKSDTEQTIHVRAWQPDEFQGKKLSDIDILGLEDFSIDSTI